MIKRAAIAYRVMQRRSEIAKRERAQQARANVESRNPISAQKKADLSVRASDKSQPKVDTRASVARETKIPERKIRAVAEVVKVKPELADKIADLTTRTPAFAKTTTAKRTPRRKLARQAPEELR